MIVMDPEIVRALVLLVAGGLGGYGVRTLEFRRQQRKEKKAEFRDKLNELHAGVLQAAHSFSKFATAINEFSWGEHKDLTPMLAISKFTQLSSEKMSDLHSLQRRYAPEFTDSWVKVKKAEETLYVNGAQVLVGQNTVAEVTKSLNLLNRNLDLFARNIEEKIREL